MKLNEAKIGDRVEVLPWKLMGTVVGYAFHSNGSIECVLIGHQNGPLYTHHHHRPMNETRDSYVRRTVNVELAHKFERGAWFGNNCECRLLDQPVVKPDQKCSQCQKPSPHSNPNKDDKFICIWCELEEDFTEELPHTD